GRARGLVGPSVLGARIRDSATRRERRVDVDVTFKSVAISLALPVLVVFGLARAVKLPLRSRRGLHLISVRFRISIRNQETRDGSPSSHL
ncbi:MAG: hypothetical protein AAGJ83_04050, partial [Planctomycetota bacterium]